MIWKYTDDRRLVVYKLDGSGTSKSVSDPEIVEYLAAGGVIEDADPPPPVSRMLPKKVIFDRAVTMGVFDRLYAVLHSNTLLYETWSAYPDMEVDPLDERMAQVFAATQLTAEEIATLIAPE